MSNQKKLKKMENNLILEWGFSKPHVFKRFRGAFQLPDGSLLRDFGGELLVIIDKELANQREIEIGRVEIPCTARFFNTKAGRPAVRLTVGDSHYFWLYWGSGNKEWSYKMYDYFPADMIVGGGSPNSNGGGCWVEFWVRPKSGEPNEFITLEEQKYYEEISGD